MNDITPTRDDSWTKALDLLSGMDESSSVSLMVILRRGRGRRPNDVKTTALFHAIAARVSASTHESYISLTPFASMQSCLVEASIKWAKEILQQPEINAVQIRSNMQVSAGKTGSRRGLPGKSTWCSGLMQQ